ncbi:helix-turn-helix domain-containing protein [Rhodococcus sp. 077-4]|uniref:helix-turn-helix domain-containing protein n=1 Tax=Rhodococcus sp. 077-4 TaxID=2789271 RepID=UPI0039F5E4BE
MSNNDTKVTVTDDIWDALYEDPVEAELVRVKSTIMDALLAHMTAQGWDQTEAGMHFSVTQPRISQLNTGKLSKFTTDALLKMAANAGLHVDVRFLETA